MEIMKTTILLAVLILAGCIASRQSTRIDAFPVEELKSLRRLNRDQVQSRLGKPTSVLVYAKANVWEYEGSQQFITVAFRDNRAFPSSVSHGKDREAAYSYYVQTPISGTIDPSVPIELMEPEGKEDNVVGGENITKAVTLACGHVKAYLLLVKRTGTSPYRVIAAQNLLQKGDPIWLVTFKPADLIPKDPAREAIGAGGEIFVTVDLASKQCTMKHGE